LYIRNILVLSRSLSRALTDTPAVCAECRKRGLSTRAESYHGRQLQLCTFHYWLLRGRQLGFTLEGYAEGSRKNSFGISLPTKDEVMHLLGREGSPSS
jgi:hypothetical protein